MCISTFLTTKFFKHNTGCSNQSTWIWNAKISSFYFVPDPPDIFSVHFRPQDFVWWKVDFFDFPDPTKCFSIWSLKKTLCGVGKIEKIDFSPNKCNWSEMPRKNIRRVRNNVKTWYFDVSNPPALIWTPCTYQIGKQIG